jgi:equilibrative nucleoside transporter 1/2/3
MGIANSFAQGGIFGFAGIFPPKYTGAVMLGNGFSGLAMNVLRMITLAAFPPSDDDEGDDKTAFIGCLIYFAIASFIIVMCIIGYFWVCKTKFARYYLKKAGNKLDEQSITIDIAARSAGSIGNGNVLMAQGYNEHSGSLDEDETHALNPAFGSSLGSPKSFLEVYRDVAPMALQVFMCFTITFVVFPGTTLSTTFDFLGDSKRDQAWFSVIMITLFNLFDTIGRFAGGWKQLLTPGTVFVLSIFRLIFIPT